MSLQRRAFLQGLVTAVAGAQVILKASDAEIAQFAPKIGDSALIASNLRTSSDPINMGCHCTIRFQNGPTFDFEVVNVEIPPMSRNVIDVLLRGDTDPRYVQGLHRPTPITLTPIGPIKIT